MSSNSSVQIVVVDDEKYICDVMLESLSGEGYGVTAFNDPLIALDFIADNQIDLVLTDLMMGEHTGLQILETTMAHHSDAVTILMTAHPTVQTAIAVLTQGAYDFLVKPFKLEVLKATIARGLAHQKILRDKLHLEAQVDFLRAANSYAVTENVDDYLRLILRSCKVELGATAAAFIRVNPKTHEVAGTLCDADSKTAEAAVLDLTSVRQILADQSFETQVQTTRITVAAQEKSIQLISKPIVIDTAICGIINLQTISWFGRITPGQFDILTILTNSAASAITASNLYYDLRTSYLQAIHALANAIEARDPYTAGHTDRVLKLAELIARKMNWSEKQIDHLTVGCTLHDIGKIGVPDAVLNKVGKLTDEEWKQMMKHPTVGLKIVRHIDLFAPAVPYIISHHERYDGNGYPDGLKGEEIPFEGRLLAVADTFDAIVSDRPYRKGASFETAVLELIAHSGTQFDASVVVVFLEVILENGKSLQQWYNRPIDIDLLQKIILTETAQA
ncbi:MAG: response regulator [candidate division Zixibacteria bacterium]|nr:response regulator [candidate division Zixibacteria bacterium]